MQDIVLELLNFFGLSTVPTTVSDFLFWFVTFIIGIEFILFIFDGIFFVIRSVGRSVR